MANRAITLTLESGTYTTKIPFVLAKFQNFLCIPDMDFLAIFHVFPVQRGLLNSPKPKFPVFWQRFQIPCVFPDRDIFWPFSPVFPVLLMETAP